VSQRKKKGKKSNHVYKNSTRSDGPDELVDVPQKKKKYYFYQM